MELLISLHLWSGRLIFRLAVGHIKSSPGYHYSEFSDFTQFMSSTVKSQLKILKVTCVLI